MPSIVLYSGEGRPVCVCRYPAQREAARQACTVLSLTIRWANVRRDRSVMEGAAPRRPTGGHRGADRTANYDLAFSGAAAGCGCDDHDRTSFANGLKRSLGRQARRPSKYE